MLLIFSCGYSASLLAKGITIDWMENEKINGKYLLNAKISYAFSDEVLDALEHGVALYFNVYIKTSMKRQLLWDKIINENTLNYRLVYHPLSQRYLLTEYNNFKLQDFRTLDMALNSMGSINEYPLADSGMISPDNQYITRVRVILDNKSLPAPLRPLSYISSEWQLSSPWETMVIEP